MINLSTVSEKNNSLISPLKHYIGQQLSDYCWVINNVHYIATMLHSNLKSFNHTSSQKYHAEVLLKSEFEKHHQLEQQHPLSNNNRKKQIQQNKQTQLSISLDDIFDLPTLVDELLDNTE